MTNRPHNKETDSQIALEGIEGKMEASTWRKIHRLLDKHPERFTAVLRNWMNEDRS